MLKIIAKGAMGGTKLMLCLKLIYIKFNFEAENKMIIAGILLENVESKRRYADLFECNCREEKGIRKG